MRYIIEFVALAVGLPLLLRYFKARPERFRGLPPHVFRSWSRGGRLAFVWTLLIFTVVVAIPACLTGAFVLLDADTCTGVTAAAWACHGPGRYVLAAALLVLISAGALKWCALLARVQNYKADELGE
jgi:hypothetical protein